MESPGGSGGGGNGGLLAQVQLPPTCSARIASRHLAKVRPPRGDVAARSVLWPTNGKPHGLWSLHSTKSRTRCYSPVTILPICTELLLQSLYVLQSVCFLLVTGDRPQNASAPGPQSLRRGVNAELLLLQALQELPQSLQAAIRAGCDEDTGARPRAAVALKLRRESASASPSSSPSPMQQDAPPLPAAGTAGRPQQPTTAAADHDARCTES